jgi:hypothetical protein
MTATMNLDDLNELAGSRSDGYTPEDVSCTSGRIQEILGYRWVVVWDYCDQYGCGGSSEEFLVAVDGVWYPSPEFLHELLFAGTVCDRATVESELAELQPFAPGQLDADPAKLHEVDSDNYAVQVTEGDGRYL